MKAALGGLELWYNARRIIGSKLLVANATRPGTHGVVGRFEGNSFETGLVVWTNGGCDYVEQGRARGSNAKGPLRSDQSGAEVEGVTTGAGCGGASISAGVERGVREGSTVSYVGMKR